MVPHGAVVYWPLLLSEENCVNQSKDGWKLVYDYKRGHRTTNHREDSGSGTDTIPYPGVNYKLVIMKSEIYS